MAWVVNGLPLFQGQRGLKAADLVLFVPSEVAEEVSAEESE